MTSDECETLPRGRHRRADPGAIPTPAGGTRPRGVPERTGTREAETSGTPAPGSVGPPSRLPRQRRVISRTEPDPPDPPAGGLLAFNLGTIPASVTPPPTWRRAAWFAVSTATAVAVALSFAAVWLVGNPRKTYTIDALPSLPGQRLTIADQVPGQALAAPGAGQPSAEPTGSAAPGPTRPARPPDGTDPAADTRATRPDSRAQGPAPAGTGPGVPRSAARRTVEPASMPPSDPDKLGDLTEQYYAHVVEDPGAAHALTAGPMHAEGPQGISARYAGIALIEIKLIMIDPNWSFTRSLLVVVREDGSWTTTQRELTFTQGSQPRIRGDRGAR